jgi:hypothetical protein
MRQQRLLAGRAAVRPRHPAIGPVPRTSRPDGTPGNQILTTKVGLQFPVEVSFDSWKRAGVQISGIVDTFAWCIGDWLVYGQRRYPDRYKQAVHAVGLNYQTLRNYASVARRVDLPRRRPTLSFQHHAEVAAQPDAEQDTWLSRAEQGGWSRNQLRQHLRSERRGQATEPMTTVLPKLTVQNERIAKWRLAAATSSSQFEHWIVTALDQAAAQELDT